MLNRCLSIALTLAMLTGCATAPRNGHLVIAGGNPGPHDDAIYGRVMELAGPGAPIGVLLTASGIPEESGPEHLADFNERGGTATLIDIPMDSVADASDPAKAAQIEAKRAIFFVGGDQSRIIRAFRPDTGDTVAYTALWRVLDRGGVISGSSAGAAMMCDPCIRGGPSEEALLNGLSTDLEEGFRVDRGMGFFPYGTVDQHFLVRGRLGRLVAAMEITGEKRGFGVEEARAMSVDLATHAIEAIGPRSVMIVETNRARRDGLRRTGIEVSLLGDGDRIHGKTGKIDPVAGKSIRAGGSGTLAETRQPAWEECAISEAMIALAASADESVTLSSEAFDLVFSKTNRTQIYGTASESWTDDPTIIRMKLDILPRAPG